VASGLAGAAEALVREEALPSLRCLRIRCRRRTPDAETTSGVLRSSLTAWCVPCGRIARANITSFIERNAPHAAEWMLWRVATWYMRGSTSPSRITVRTLSDRSMASAHTRLARGVIGTPT
jgi:hypothetical protein